MTKKLIALAVIAAGVLAVDSKEIPVGQPFEAADDLAEKLIAAGDAKEEAPAAPAPAKGKTVKARVLVDGTLGKINQVIDVPQENVKTLESEGQIDTSKAAVTYALSLKTDD
ncbi:hypothetical protein [Rhodoferax sp. TS-BS-61-7]|uniref:hypothetical protein n=1 Tax=Rhodoferax sp. TS-BS-61-7 TaxID=2094194 RepID=UPI000CF6AEF6|nr:hypothetical protein [Rhodoferax sp. TS-BS-61-7]PQA78694.1 hypothetical protein C5F53_01575 [Rhodoferax sp. TS-BS-61-7]